jgi:hypothetical protein
MSEPTHSNPTAVRVDGRPRVTAGLLFTIAVVTLMLVALISQSVRRRRESPTRELVQVQPVIYSTRAAVLIHARGTQGSGWGSLKGAGWPQLVVHSGGLEVTIGAFDGLITGNTMLTEGATMRRERLPAWPLVAGNRDCITLRGSDGTGPREWKVSPRGTSIEEVWAQLIAAGVTPTT